MHLVYSSFNFSLLVVPKYNLDLAYIC